MQCLHLASFGKTALYAYLTLKKSTRKTPIGAVLHEQCGLSLHAQVYGCSFEHLQPAAQFSLSCDI